MTPSEEFYHNTTELLGFSMVSSDLDIFPSNLKSLVWHPAHHTVPSFQVRGKDYLIDFHHSAKYYRIKQWIWGGHFGIFKGKDL